MKSLKKINFGFHLLTKSPKASKSEVELFSSEELSLLNDIQEQLTDLNVNQSKLRFMSREIQKVIKKIK